MITSNDGNFTKGRTQKIIIGVFHRTAISGDTALGEANYSHNHILKASYYKVIDTKGAMQQSVLATDTEWATDDWGINQESLNYEITGLNGSPVTSAQLNALIADIKADPATKGIANHRLTLAEIATRKVSGWCTHKDITAALKIAGGHTDYITEAEISQILGGIK